MFHHKKAKAFESPMLVIEANQYRIDEYHDCYQVITIQKENAASIRATLSLMMR